MYMEEGGQAQQPHLQRRRKMGWLKAQQEIGLHHRGCRSGELHLQGVTLKKELARVWLPFQLWALLHFLIPGSCSLGWKGAHRSQRGRSRREPHSRRQEREEHQE